MEYPNVMMMNKWQVPTFGNWDYYDHPIPVTHYFESARQADLIRRQFYAEESDLFKPPPSPCSYKKCGVCQRKVSPTPGNMEIDAKEKSMKVVKRAPKAVDEDLYKIPPEQLMQRKNKRKVAVSDFWKGCLGLSCIA